MKRILLGLAVVGLLSGCSAPAPTPEPVAAADPIAAEVPCKLFSTLVLTPIANGNVAFDEKRFSQQERDGMYVQAAEGLGVLKAEPGTGVADALAVIQAIPSYASFDPSSAEWITAREDMVDACAAEGFEVYTSMWTGG